MPDPKSDADDLWAAFCKQVEEDFGLPLDEQTPRGGKEGRTANQFFKATGELGGTMWINGQ